jgi:hypothetical protein
MEMLFKTLYAPGFTNRRNGEIIRKEELP